MDGQDRRDSSAAKDGSAIAQIQTCLNAFAQANEAFEAEVHGEPARLRAEVARVRKDSELAQLKKDLADLASLRKWARTRLATYEIEPPSEEQIASHVVSDSVDIASVKSAAELFNASLGEVQRPQPKVSGTSGCVFVFVVPVLLGLAAWFYL